MDARQLTLLWNSFHFQEELQREKALRVEMEMRLEKANAAASIAGGSYSSEAPVAGEARIRTLHAQGPMNRIPTIWHFHRLFHRQPTHAP